MEGAAYHFKVCGRTTETAKQGSLEVVVDMVGQTVS
jgi:hypothetical protein